MNLKELSTFKLHDAIFFHDELNPVIFLGDRMRSEVRQQLMIIAEDFVDHLGIEHLAIEDVTLSGSNASYTYTKHSDIDLHILVDMKKLNDDAVYRELFDAKKTLYNDTHDITIGGYEVELYVQDSNQPVVSLGEYSVMNDSWLRLPKKSRANFDQNATRLKFNKLAHFIEIALKYDDQKKIKDVLAKIKKYRKTGLDIHGEFGPENLAFKALRSKGKIKKLYDKLNQLHSEKLSLPEDFDPNGPPPGPEFKPTMPAGTVKVDVSDVYDWYKLGQHISDLEGLGKHDFGRGPPSTIFSFGSEEAEHKYIKNLEKTGLTTTDIDPFDPNQPKGMKRQKTDPTYNVNEVSGYIPSKKEKNDPRFKTALTVDVTPNSIKDNAKKLGSKISRAGIPPLLRP